MQSAERAIYSKKWGPRMPDSAMLGTDTAYALLAGKLGHLLRSSRTFRRRQRYFTATMYVGLGLAAAFSGVV